MTSLAVAGVITLLLVLLPGAASSFQLPVPRATQLLLAPVFSLASIMVAAEAMDRLGIPWSVLGPLVVAALFALLIALIRLSIRLARGPHRESATVGSAPAAITPQLVSERFFWSIALGAAVLVLVRMHAIMDRFGNISQTYDNIFHLNAVRYILDHRDASAWFVGSMTLLEEKRSYYPSLFHQTSSLIVDLSGVEIHIANNVLLLFCACFLWPLGALCLARWGLGLQRLGLAVTALFSGTFASFPYVSATFGILLPYFLAMALLPVLVLLVLRLVSLGSAWIPWPLALGLAALAAIVIAGAHPQGIHSAIAILLPLLLWTAVGAIVSAIRTRRGGWRAAALVALTVAAGAVSWFVWMRLRPNVESAVWPVEKTNIPGLLAVLGQMPAINKHVAWVSVIVTVVAIALVLYSRRNLWLLGSFAAVGAIYFVGLSIAAQPLRYWVTGVWYSDSHRFAVLPCMITVLIVGCAADAAVPALRRLVPSAQNPPQLVAIVAAALAVLTMISSSSVSVWRQYNEKWASEILLSADELEVLRELPSLVPEDAVIATNAWNGSSLAYAYSDRRVLNMTPSFEAQPEVHLLNRALDDQLTDPAVCEARHDLNVDYALDFGPKEIHNRRATYVGLNDFDENESATVVLERGNARLLKLTPCTDTDGRTR